jgi:tRNA uridine 5-carboxymethylaminomethyl modification enzyme
MWVMSKYYDVIVVGGGHAGVEAAYAAARMGSRTLLITLNPEKIGFMYCNPAVGGIGKGHMVFEISELGGLMPQLCTQTYLQARMLNTRKGPAVQGLRLQIDKLAYHKLSRKKLSEITNLTIVAGMVDRVEFDTKHKVSGIVTREGATYEAPSVIITTGTFLNGLIHTGQNNRAAGPQGEESSLGLAAFLRTLNLKVGRLKTGTPPRLLRSSIDFSSMERQGSDELSYLFEFNAHRVTHKIDCHITHTTEKTHEIIKRNFHLSPIFTGSIKGTPPRYCPSIEDKISRFADKLSHHVFVEPESASCGEIYPNGLSTSLPFEVQEEFIRSIPGFERALIVRPGYAIEYDYVAPNQLRHTLELQDYPGLFLAGQINGTTGYEEAAGQGIIAGINAHRAAHGESAYVMERTEGYIGIMIDDLVTQGVDEPYRMFTSRAERRLLLRQDNVFFRLADKAHELSLMDSERYQSVKHEEQVVQQTVHRCTENQQQHRKLMQLIATDNLEQFLQDIEAYAPEPLSERMKTNVYAELLYQPYFKRELREVEKLQYYQTLTIPASLSFVSLPGLSVELQQKLTHYRPATIAQAAQIRGMTPAALSLLIFKSREILDNHSSTSCC